MPNKYINLLSPIKIGNVVFKNRIIASRSSPLFIQNSDPFPNEALITHYANKAKNGAAVVTCGRVGMPHVIPDRDLSSFSPGQIVHGNFDIDDARCQDYLARLAEAIHFYGAKASMQIGGYVPVQYDVSTGIPSISPSSNMTPRTGVEIPVDLLDAVADDFAHQAALLKVAGFDMVYLHMAYRLTILGRFLSPLTNKRTDHYGGSLANGARFPVMVAARIKQKCGEDFLIEASISGCDPPGGRTLEETIELARILAGYFDILQIRAPDTDSAHPTGFNRERTPFLHMAEAIKKGGVNIAIATVGGYFDLGVCERVIASGQADFIAMARSLISNPDYGRLLYEGRREDIVPCIRCNLCFTGVCAVNPIWGLEHRVEKMIAPPVGNKKVAIVGGGPAGMEAALITAGRGHRVTLYEKSSSLGGLLKTTDNVSFKWPLRDFKNYLIRQITKANVKVFLNTEATPEMLKNEEYNALLVAVGAEPIVPRITGVDGVNVVFAGDVYGNEDSLSKKVVIIGGGEVGVETGMHLAAKGHDVTLLEMLDKLASNAPSTHFYSTFKDAWEKRRNLKCIMKARCIRIAADKVIYTDAHGKEQTIEAGSVVIAVGMKPRNNLALKFYGAADRFFMIGDCIIAANVQKAIRGAFSAASLV